MSGALVAPGDYAIAMLTDPFATPLEPAWRHILETLAREQGWPFGSNDRLAAGVAALSEAYNQDHAAPSRLTIEMQAARLGFFFPRDVPKGAAAVRELASLLSPHDGRVLRILDLGAGLGASTIGAARFVRAAGHIWPVESLAVDRDEIALRLAVRLAASVEGLALTSWTGELRSAPVRPPYDLILLGQVLCELDGAGTESDRAERHAQLLRSLLELLSPRGALVIIEPALRGPTRHLHRVRDRLATTGVTIYSPCLHAGGCPMLRREQDWCHEQLAVDLPDWLVPVARAAGLRSEGLTFAQLVLRRDGLTRRGALRVVSAPLRTKGRLDAWLCGEFSSGPDRRKVGRLDRHASDKNRVWDDVSRGELVVIEPLTERIDAETRIHRT